MGKRNENIIKSGHLKDLEFCLNRLLWQKRFNPTDENFIQVGERTCLENLKGLKTFDLFMLNDAAHNVYDVFSFKMGSNASQKDQEEYLIKELQRRLATAAESYPAFESLSKLFDEKINTNMRILLMDSNFSKTMASMSRAIKGKITTVMDELTADEGNYDKSAEPEVLEVAKRLFDLDTQNYKKKDQDSIVQALDKAQKEFSEFIGPFNDKRYSMDSYGVMCYVVGDHIAAMYGKNYFETPDEWSKKRVVRW